MFGKLFTWWNSATMGTSFTLWRRGAELIGKDEQGNRYFEEAKSDTPGGVRRRWVIYHGIAEGSRVTPDWHGWLHHTFEEPPTAKPHEPKTWEKDHLPNMTGTPLAYHPTGSLARKRGVDAIASDYESWKPESA